MKGKGLPAGIGRPAHRHNQAREMLVPCPTCSVLAAAHARRPGRAVHLEFRAPVTGKIDHLVTQLRRRKHRGRKPVQQYRRLGLQPGTGLNDMGGRVNPKARAVGQAVIPIREGERQFPVVLIGPVKGEPRHKRRALACAHDCARLARK